MAIPAASFTAGAVVRDAPEETHDVLARDPGLSFGSCYRLKYGDQFVGGDSSDVAYYDLTANTTIFQIWASTSFALTSDDETEQGVGHDTPFYLWDPYGSTDTKG
ncbi:hypothetical protein N8T08_007790 [Aspergillus melleus]|uniref:Uncharacterized protein n=1 Tax=Aspergillus melleus TaxID=138277 RepID=A0ACC3BEK5_9EURO|nr:hypothetical protein N8T08_007790 [Aspergillus melleus]